VGIDQQSNPQVRGPFGTETADSILSKPGF